VFHHLVLELVQMVLPEGFGLLLANGQHGFSYKALPA
jgi:hypothetical protein